MKKQRFTNINMRDKYIMLEIYKNTPEKIEVYKHTLERHVYQLTEREVDKLQYNKLT